MKKIIAIFLFAAYTATAFGVTLNFHYCGDQLDHVSFLNFEETGGCSCTSGTMPKDCCQDKIVYHKTDNHKNLLESFSFNSVAFSHLLQPATDRQDYKLRSVIADLNYINHQVRHSRPLAIFLAIQSIRI
ncbi:MAG: hypothetical protein B7X86_06560 [Sphingobacteriales bacterium 17-39-43]|jgi:hypothetical protein|uniref:HYC_CC_PP family protein n=1 Tax=Daejeonella sp. TaxID=2805397 RepID=UPI000BDBC1F5|nr:hypothetical protein [Daejeonella sp.]OYZ31655.1 MAG: hypothetical protein B7Y24_07375 [Sphingobacteriales bacterium 16-39-50]OZA25050.1 MAG: hypothetical protein B7X86_06560 [Sphingobacteriales bacterium 17-39-43]OZA61628.1 MAG: hypothetical protein B7X75_01815 [Sphingobacteriales bacterium 39-40-5]HQS50733.1 hypothetical protein [Daejeonella sp.]HQT23637.1 hypothetical protein [Daejeonella sp.]